MRIRLLQSVGAAAVLASALGMFGPAQMEAQDRAVGVPSGDSAAPVALRTPWGEPDLQGIWTVESDTPLQRSPKYANQEFFTEAQREELDRERAALLGRDRRVARGTELDVAGAYNAVFMSKKRTGLRTSLIVDPLDGRVPPLTPQAEKIAGAERDFRLALLRATETCRTRSIACAGGKYDPTPSPRRAELAPRYNTTRINRHDGPEDGALADRCLTGGLPEFGTAYGGSFRRIVQTPGGITMFYDVGQGQGWQRNIVMNGSPHLPAGIRQWYGDSRGHWEGDTLVIDVTNFSPKTDFQGSRENLHLVEHWTRADAATLRYVVTIEDPTVWTRPWTVAQEFTKQSEQENRVYYEPRCIEGNYAFPAMMLAARLEDLAFAEGRGPSPATKDNATDFVGVEADPFQ
ncbi:MAG TPA: hypothetical protein VKW08_12860 [Xanthobacteraceae bacterium]|jgi:hypothetical protein|nr:hypothetical protein [Xanthobacteraceae bacterium]